MPRKLTQAEYERRVRIKNPNIVITSKYLGSQSPIDAHCTKCGYNWSTSAGHLTKDSGCPKCHGEVAMTQKEFEAKLHKSSPTLQLVGSYSKITAFTKVKVHCTKCGNTWGLDAGELKKRKGCKFCENRISKVRRAKSYKKFVKRIKANNPDIEILGQFKGLGRKIEARCTCGRIWYPLAKTVAKGGKCPVCTKAANDRKEALSQSTFEKQVHALQPNIKVLGTYKNAATKIKVKCTICKHKWEPFAGSLLQGWGCPYCARKRISKKERLSQSEFKQRVHTLNPNIKVLVPYKGAGRHIKVQCTKDGCIWTPFAGELLRGEGCPRCMARRIGNLHRLTDAEFKMRLHKVSPKLKPLSPYKTIHARVRIQCTECGFIWEAPAQNLLLGERCPNCFGNISIGEQETMDYLKHKGYSFKYQFVFPDCKYINPLPFDFAVFDTDAVLSCVIEYQGSQHFEPVARFGGTARFKRQLARDKAKREYCARHNIQLITIDHKPNMADTRKFIKQLVKKTLDRQLCVH